MKSHICLRSVSVSLAAMVLAGPALAQEETPQAAFVVDGAAQSEDIPAWYVTCATPGDADTCVSQQALALPETNQRLLTVMVQSNMEGGESLILQLPHGLWFQAGVQLSVDGGAVTQAALSTSDVTGVYAGASLSEELASAMRAGQTLTVGFTSVDGEQYGIPVELGGFSAALDMRRQGVASE